MIRSALFVLSLFIFLLKGFAQQNHFIYLQTENKQPFYVKLEKKLISSSASGYLIIPKLQEGEYILTIGFPKNEFTEQVIACKVGKKDAGYVLKNFGSKGWGLFNLQTMEIVVSGAKAEEKNTVIVENKKDDFSNTLSNVVKDPSIAQKEEEVKPASIAPPLTEIKQQEIKQPEVKQNEGIKQTGKNDAVTEQQVPLIKQASSITRVLSNNNAEGTDLVYVDIENGLPDTVRVFIPAEKKIPESPVEKTEKPVEIKTVPKIEEDKTAPTAEAIAEKKPEIKQQPKTEIKTEAEAIKAPKFMDISLPNPNAKADTALKPADAVVTTEKKTEITAPVVSEKQKENATHPVIMNSDCKAQATDEDFLKLRKKMAAEDNDDDMLGIARKVFKAKCFTTEQVKNLCVLFLKDEGRYKFFDLAYPYVSDSYNFGSLETQLKDVYYIDRFRVMLRH